MRNRWLIPVVILVALAGFFTAANYYDWGPDRDHNEVQTIVHSDGTTETVTIERDWDGGPPFFFFPFGILFFIFLIAMVGRFIFGGYRGGPPPWARDEMRRQFEQWHREEHEKMAS